SAPMTDGQNQSINPTSDGKLFYSAKHVFPNNSIAVYFSIRDSVGQIIFQRLEFNYWEFFDHINKNDRYLIGQNGGMGKYECKLFGSNANLTDTFSTKYSNYQSKLDKALKILIDNNGDVILIGELSDTSLN